MSITPLTDTTPYAPDRTPTVERPLRLGARDLGVAGYLPPHKHPWGQVTYALEGVFRVTVDDSAWIVPPLRAIWIAPDVVHEVVVLEKVQLRPVLVHPTAVPFSGKECKVLNVSKLLRELIISVSQLDESGRREALLSELILDELARSVTLPMRVALPRDKRLKQLCEMLIAAPSSALTLGDWAAKVGASERTLARLFEQDLGTSFGTWRQQMRLAHAAPLIARGMPLSLVAAELGYASQSAFSAMFKKTFGQSPSVFFANKGS